MSDEFTFTAQTRERAGKGAARATRRAGRIPAVIYGDKKDPIMVSLDPKEFLKELNQGGFFTNVYNIAADGETHKVLPRDVQFHPVTDAPLHADFLRMSKGLTVAVEVVVNFINEDESPGLKRGGVINVVRHEVELSCPADSIPSELIIDLTGTDIGDSIHISQISLPDGVAPTITDRDFTVATIAAPTVMKTVEEEEAEEAEIGEEGEEGEAEEIEE